MADIKAESEDASDNTLVEIIELKDVDDGDDSEIEHETSVSAASTVNHETDPHSMRNINSRQLQALEPVMTSSHDILSDDETPKVYYTLTAENENKSLKNNETLNKKLIKKALESGKQNKQTIEEIVLQEVIQNEGDEDESSHSYIIKEFEGPKKVSQPDEMSEIARKQLENLSNIRRKTVPHPKFPNSITVTKLVKPKVKESEVYIQVINDDKPVKLPCHILGRSKTNPEQDPMSNGRNPVPARAGVKLPPVQLGSPVLSKKELEKEITDKFSNKSSKINAFETHILSKHEQIKLAPKKNTESITYTIETINESGIEIPQDMLLNDVISPSKIHEMTITNSDKEEESEDLIAILEGHEDDNINEVNKSLELKLEREIAIQQFKSLPKTIRGRKKIVKNQQNKKTETSKTPLEKEASKYVESLVNDWSDNESKLFEDIEKSITTTTSPTKIKQETPVDKPLSSTTKPSVTTKRKTPIPVLTNPEPQGALKRSRIIKKKIIWDPDAPETQFSYASLVNSSTKKAVIKKTQLVVKTPQKATKSDYQTPQKRSATVSPSPRKKVKSEIDKLLSDEGAINMLNELERETNNSKDNEKRQLKTRNFTKTDNSTPIAISLEVASKSKVKKEVVSPKATTAKPAFKKKPTRGSLKDCWDYVYRGRDNEDSMIIRRRSNSSYSSTASPRRLSIDTSNLQNNHSFESENETNSLKNNSPVQVTDANLKLSNEKPTFEFAKPNSKKQGNRRSGNSDDNVLVRKKPDTPRPLKTKSEDTILSDDNIQFSPLIEIQFYDNFAEFSLTTKLVNSKHNFLTKERMNEIIEILKSLESNDSVNVVLISSYKNNFCDGVDFSDIVCYDLDKRTKTVKDLSQTLLKFLLALIRFPKTLIAGVQGNVTNLGVTILSAFDFVIADQTVVFRTHYSVMGQLPEANAIINSSKRLRSHTVHEILYLSQVISPNAALEKGLVTSVAKHTTYQQYLLNKCAIVGSRSGQFLQSMKQTKQHIDFVTNLELNLIDEHKILTRHWLSDECQNNLRRFLDTDKW